MVFSTHTIRLDDGFFKSNWEEFDNRRKKMLKESQERSNQLDGERRDKMLKEAQEKSNKLDEYSNRIVSSLAPNRFQNPTQMVLESRFISVKKLKEFDSWVNTDVRNRISRKLRFRVKDDDENYGSGSVSIEIEKEPSHYQAFGSRSESVETSRCSPEKHNNREFRSPSLDASRYTTTESRKCKESGSRSQSLETLDRSVFSREEPRYQEKNVSRSKSLDTSEYSREEPSYQGKNLSRSKSLDTSEYSLEEPSYQGKNLSRSSGIESSRLKEVDQSFNVGSRQNSFKRKFEEKSEIGSQIASKHFPRRNSLPEATRPVKITKKCGINEDTESNNFGRKYSFSEGNTYTQNVNRRSSFPETKKSDQLPPRYSLSEGSKQNKFPRKWSFSKETNSNSFPRKGSFSVGTKTEKSFRKQHEQLPRRNSFPRGTRGARTNKIGSNAEVSTPRRGCRICREEF